MCPSVLNRVAPGVSQKGLFSRWHFEGLPPSPFPLTGGARGLGWEQHKCSQELAGPPGNKGVAPSKTPEHPFAVPGHSSDSQRSNIFRANLWCLWWEKVKIAPVHRAESGLWPLQRSTLSASHPDRACFGGSIFAIMSPHSPQGRRETLLGQD